MYEAVVVADSISPEGHRITSVYTVYPHAVHKDFLRHGLLRARSVESFRARPTELLIEDLERDGAFRPDVFAGRVAGMAQGEGITDQDRAGAIWDNHVAACLQRARELGELDIAKQQRNFVLQDLCPLKEIITATDWSNFFALRLETDDDGRPVARPEIYKTALAIKEAIDASTPVELEHGQFHLPLVTTEELLHVNAARNEHLSVGDRERVEELDRYWCLVSAGRCARFSYAKGFVPEPATASFQRGVKLVSAGHTVPLEHAARPFSAGEWEVIRALQRETEVTDAWADELFLGELHRQLEYSSALHGWRPFRKMVPNEHDYSLLQADAA